MSGKNVLKYWSQVGIDRLRDRGRNEADLVVGSGQRKTKVEQLENEQVSVISIDIYKNRLLIDPAHLP